MGCGVKVHSFALFEDFYLIFNPKTEGFGVEALEGLVHGFAAEAEGAVVHGDHLLGAEVDEGANGFLGAGVDGAVSIREISADRQQGDLGMEAIPDLAEAVEVGGVSGVIERVSGGFKEVSAVAAMGVAEDARPPVTAGGHGYLQALHCGGLPPLESVDGGEAQSFDKVFDSARNDHLGGPSGETASGPDDSSQGGEVEVIHVGVSQQHEVDGRQFVDRDAGMALAAQHNQSFGEDGVDEDSAPGDLE